MWAQAIAAAIGVWLMASPSILDYGDPARTNDWIVGPIVASLGVMATAGVLRELRWVFLPLGVWLVLAPWALGYALAATLNSAISGALLALLAFVRGTVEQRFGGGWSSLLPGRDVDRP